MTVEADVAVAVPENYGVGAGRLRAVFAPYAVGTAGR